METVEENVNEDMDASSFVDSLSHLTENSSALGIRLLALEEYCNRAQNDMEILKKKIRLLSNACDNTLRTRDELLSRNKTNVISLERLYNVQFEFYKYECDAKNDYIRREEALKNKKAEYDEIITSYKTKWDAVKLEYEKLPVASELSVLEKENVILDAEAKELESLVAKTKAEYLEKYNECWSNLLAKILEFVTEYQTHTKFVMASEEIEQKNADLQKLFQKLQCCEEQQVGRQYSDYFKPIPLVTSIPSKGRGTHASKFDFDLASFDEISVPQDNLEKETEDETLFNLYENERNSEITQNRNSALSSENTDPKKKQKSVQKVDPVAVNECRDENRAVKEVTERDTRSSGNHSKDKAEVLNGDTSRPDSHPHAKNVNDKKLQPNNQHLTSDVDDAARLHSKSSKSVSGVKFADAAAPKKESKSVKLKEKKKEIRKPAHGEDKENDRSRPKKGKFSFDAESAKDSPKKSRAERVSPDNHPMFSFDFGKGFIGEENEGNEEEDKFSFFMKPNCSFTQSGSIFKLF